MKSHKNNIHREKRDPDWKIERKEWPPKGAKPLWINEMEELRKSRRGQ